MLNPYVFLWESTKISGKQDREVIHKEKKNHHQTRVFYKIKGWGGMRPSRAVIVQRIHACTENLDNDEKSKKPDSISPALS